MSASASEKERREVGCCTESGGAAVPGGLTQRLIRTIDLAHLVELDLEQLRDCASNARATKQRDSAGSEQCVVRTGRAQSSVLNLIANVVDAGGDDAKSTADLWKTNRQQPRVTANAGTRRRSWFAQVAL